MTSTQLDDLALDLLARLLPLAHRHSVTQTEIGALALFAVACHALEVRAVLSLSGHQSKGTPMTTRYDAPSLAAKVGNELIRWLAEAGISIAGTRALRVRGRKTGKRRGVVINLLTVGGRDYVVSPRGDTQWARNARAAGVVEIGPRWRSREVRLTEVSDDAKPPLLRRYLDRWYWEVKGHIGGLTPDSSDEQLRTTAPSIPVFELGR
jgi:hypothetical protein